MTVNKKTAKDYDCEARLRRTLRDINTAKINRYHSLFKIRKEVCDNSSAKRMFGETKTTRDRMSYSDLLNNFFNKEFDGSITNIRCSDWIWYIDSYKGGSSHLNKGFYNFLLFDGDISEPIIRAFFNLICFNGAGSFRTYLKLDGAFGDGEKYFVGSPSALNKITKIESINSYILGVSDNEFFGKKSYTEIAGSAKWLYLLINVSRIASAHKISMDLLNGMFRGNNNISSADLIRLSSIFLHLCKDRNIDARYYHFRDKFFVNDVAIRNLSFSFRDSFMLYGYGNYSGLTASSKFIKNVEEIIKDESNRAPYIEILRLYEEEVDLNRLDFTKIKV